MNDDQGYEIRIDKNGTWYYNGSEMIRNDIVQWFYQYLDRDESGNYIINMLHDRCRLEVDDAPYVVQKVSPSFSSEDEIDALHLHLNSDEIEELDPKYLRIGKDNVLYCSIRNKRFEARFSRPSYYQLADFIRDDASDGSFYIEIKKKKYILKPQ